mgnify:CR=1 FL=1
MLRLDFFGLLLTLFFLGPKHWRWGLAAAGGALVTTVLFLVVWKADLVALLAALVGPFAVYAVAKIMAWRPMGQVGWLRQILPWSELENPAAGTFAKYALLSALFALVKVLGR